MTEFTSLSLAEARGGLKKKSFSAGELTAAHVSAIEKAHPLNAFVLETPERAIEMAKASDARIALGNAGPLEGIPLAIKDMARSKKRGSNRGKAKKAKTTKKVGKQAKPIELYYWPTPNGFKISIMPNPTR